MFKKLKNVQKAIRAAYMENKRKSLLIYMILRSLVILCMIMQIIKGNYNNALLCLLSLVLLFAPMFFQNKFKITIPSGLEISIYFFIFSAEILGEIQNFYGIIPFWDTLLHTFNGFLAAAVGFSFIELLNENSKKIKLSPFYLSFVAFCFSMTIGVLWEFFEHSMDRIFYTDMQKDRIVEKISSVELNKNNENIPVVIDDITKTLIYTKDGSYYEIDNGYLDIGIIDTMKDMFVNFIGAVFFSIYGYLALKYNKKSFITNFVPTKGKRKIANSAKEILDL